MPPRPLRPARPQVQQAALYRWARVALPLGLVAALVAVRVSGSDWVRLAQFRAFDQFIRERPRLYREAPVRIVDIDEKSLQVYGQFPWPRSLLGRLVDRLTDAGAAAIAFDVVFPEPDRLGPEQDRAFARAVARGPVVLGVPMLQHPGGRGKPRIPATFGDRGEIAEFALSYPGAVPNLPVLEDAARAVGTFTTGVEQDGIIRRVPLIVQTADGLKVPSLVAEALRVASGAKTYGVKSSLSDSRGRQKTGIEKIKIGPLILPTDEQARIWHYPTREASRRVVPAWTVLGERFDASKVAGCIVFIGTSAEGLKDIRVTALDPVMPGVEVHANLAEQALLQDFLERPDWAVGAEIVTMLSFGVALTLLLSRFGAAWCFPIFLLGMAWSIGMPWYLFKEKGFLLDPVFPALTTLVVYMATSLVSYLKSELERRQVKAQFSRYLAPAMVEQLAKHPEKLKLGGESREMTFHFCDIRGFTTISEQYASDPHGLTRLINRFLTPMTDTILRRQGTIDKYMGDCIMAFWNAPLDDAEHARHACRAALEMHERLAELNAQWRAEAEAEGRRFIPIRIGTGLNTGPCVVGNMGSDQVFGYSVLGDDVNLASRLEGQSKSYGVNIVVGARTREQAPEFAALELDLIKVKGKTVPARVFALLGGPELAQAPAFKAHEELHARMIEAYRARRFAEARELLARCRKTELPLSKLYDLYERRLDAFAAEAPPADWDGTFTATSK